MKQYTWDGHDCLIVKALQPQRCVGCLFAGTEEDCPHTDASTDIVCDNSNDIIFIKNTPKALAKYLAERLE